MKKTNKGCLIWCVMLECVMLLLCVGGCASCSKKIKTYEKTDGVAFLEEIQSLSKIVDHNYVLLDVRKLDEEYALGHFYGFTNYDLTKGNVDELVSYMKGMHHIEKHIFIIDRDGSLVQDASSSLKKAGYKKISIYLGGFETLKEYNTGETYFKIVTGKEDCAC